MAQFVHQYVEQLVAGQAAAAQMLNVNLYGIDRQSWVMLLTVDTAIGVVMKAISDLTGVTDQQWVDALNHALDSSAQSPWPDALLNQADPTQSPAVD